MSGKRCALFGLAAIGVLFASYMVVSQPGKAPLPVAIIWHQHQPLYWNRLTSEYELPWVRIHGVQEYIDSPRILAEYPDVRVTYNLQPSLLWQLEDYVVITADERQAGGLFQYIGAVDNHLRWIWKLFRSPEELAAEERSALTEQAFWLNGYMLDDDENDPYYDPRYHELQSLSQSRALTDAELRDAAGLFLLWQISPELHELLGVSDLRGMSGFLISDIVQLLQSQRIVLSWVVDAYRGVAYTGSELVTSPFYHPILPLLAEFGWDEDVLAQLDAAQAQHQRLFEQTATGVWPPEQAVSDRALALLRQAGFRWTTTDGGLLAQALGHTPSTEEQTSVYVVDGLPVLFRDSDLSDGIGLAYGNKPTEAAVSDFIGRLRDIYDTLEDPAGQLLTIAVDGENWMFMAGYPDNGRSFLRALYAELASTEWIRTVTPSAFLSSCPDLVTLESVPTGSWAGDLSTWSGESDEDEAWRRLEDVRVAVDTAGDPPAAVEAVLAAQGSDWFWWYGTDQDSNTDDLYDWLFKANLVAALLAAGVEETDVPDVLLLRLQQPASFHLGEIDPVLDGRDTPDESWSDAAVLHGIGGFDEVRLGYRENLLYVQARMQSPSRTLIGEDQSLMLYVSGGAGETAVAATRYAGESLGFSLTYAAQVPLAKLRTDGTGTVTVYETDETGLWRSASPLHSIGSRRVYTDDVIEYSIPLAELGMEPGKASTLNLVLETIDSIVAQASARPVLAVLPTLVQGKEIFVMNDPVDDDTGPGSYSYPTNSVFSGGGLFDLVRYAVIDGDDRWQFAFDFRQLPNPWNGPQGFSHPLIFLYLDRIAGGSVAAHEDGAAAQVTFDPAHPWDTFIKVAGWPAYGRHLWTASGEGPTLIDVASDPKRGRVIVTVPKSVLPDVAGWHYVLIASQDGYGANHVRPIGESAGVWTGGGSTDPSWTPQLYDLLEPMGHLQQDMLASFVPDTSYAEVLPIEVDLDAGSDSGR